MADEIKISDNNVVKLANERFGTKETTMHYIKVARDAGKRAQAAASIPNAVMMAAEMQTMIDALDKIYALLSDDKNTISPVK